MPASERDYAKVPAAPVAGAHHGPGESLTARDTVAGIVERLKEKGLLDYRWLALLVVAVVGVGIWRYLAHVHASNLSKEWLELGRADSIPKLQELAKIDPSGYPGRLAKLNEARYLLAGQDRGIDGLQQIDTEKRGKAIEDIETARGMFLELERGFKGDLVFQAQCLQAAAEAEESLIGIPKGSGGQESRGSVERAAELYSRLAEVAGATTVGEGAKKKAAELTQKSNEIKSLQSDLYNRLSARTPTLDPFHPPTPDTKLPLPPIPGLPGGLDPKPPVAPAVAPVPSLPLITPTPPAVAPKAEPAPGAAKLDPAPQPKPGLSPRTPDPSIAPLLPAPVPPKP